MAFSSGEIAPSACAELRLPAFVRWHGQERATELPLTTAMIGRLALECLRSHVTITPAASSHAATISGVDVQGRQASCPTRLGGYFRYFAIDFHTGTTGFEVSAFNIGGMDVPEVKAMVELYPVGQIFDNHVYPGVLHNAFMDVGIPSFTPEIGAARVLDPEMTSLFVKGTMNVLKYHYIVAGQMGRTGKDMTVFVGDRLLCRGGAVAG